MSFVVLAVKIMGRPSIAAVDWIRHKLYQCGVIKTRPNSKSDDNYRNVLLCKLLS